MNTSCRTHRPSVTLLCVTVVLLLWSGALAQSLGGRSYNLDFTIINATTGQPGTVERLEIKHLSVAGGRILDIQPDGSTFTISDVNLRERASYLVTAWKSDVPYFWQFKGRALSDTTVTLHVFDTTDDLGATRIKGLTLIARRQESVVALDYSFNIVNDARPQVTIKGSGSTLELVLPAGADAVKAQYHRGAGPTSIDVHALGNGHFGLDVPLTTGDNRITLTTLATWSGEFLLPIKVPLPVDAWSLLVSPENLTVRCNDTEPDRNNNFPGHQRFVGEPLKAGQDVEIRITGPLPAGQPKQLFTQETAPATVDGDTAQATADTEGPPVGLIVGGILLATAIVLLLRRRSRK